MTKKDIHRTCDNYTIKNYTINYDLSIDVAGDVDLGSRGLLELPLKFRNVFGYFDCSDNDLTTLEGAPSYISEWFNCSRNNLTTLEGSLSIVIGTFYFSGNPLESLKGIPIDIKYNNLALRDKYTYTDYLNYCNSYKRDLKFKKILKCQ